MKKEDGWDSTLTKVGENMHNIEHNLRTIQRSRSDDILSEQVLTPAAETGTGSQSLTYVFGVGVDLNNKQPLPGTRALPTKT
ncbi:hypothetical protein ACO22_00959 [Paracoccidioides brasiliensis]|uniref:Uncharacterized protein n=1 Tax=Paracoccidioides brasiliensis TaxID=121759 RepID=A0A1D2JMY5_PARBR|nr:hypothetical protein ACO22_00959 [Paracoccidioides brasiliensis]